MMRAASPQMMRVGLFKSVHVKTLLAQEQRMLLTGRKLLQGELGFSPVGRARLGVPDQPGATSPASAHEMFDTILPNGKVVPCAGRK
jgi:hypothetical protein